MPTKQTLNKLVKMTLAIKSVVRDLLQDTACLHTSAVDRMRCECRFCFHYRELTALIQKAVGSK